MQQTNVAGIAYYCKETKSPSIKLSITYPNNIPNLTYNFTLTIILNKQSLFPKITYTHVHTQTIYVPKKQIILNQLSSKTMYQVIFKFNFNNYNTKNTQSKGQYTSNITQQKTIFVFTEGVREQQQQQLVQQLGEQEQQKEQLSYSKIVKQNIRDYFNQYHPSQQQQENRHNNQNQSFSQNYNHNKHNSNYQSRYSSNQSIKSFVKWNQKNTNNNKQPLCNSQTMMKVIGQNDPLINKRKIQKYILQGRKSSSVNDYLKTNHYLCFNSMNKTYKNQPQRRQHIQKTLLVAKTIDMFGQIYRNNDVNNNRQKSGREFFKNDWFMGPFYSYNQNQKQLKTNKPNNRNDLNQTIQQ